MRSMYTEGRSRSSRCNIQLEFGGKTFHCRARWQQQHPGNCRHQGVLFGSFFLLFSTFCLHSVHQTSHASAASSSVSCFAVLYVLHSNRFFLGFAHSLTALPSSYVHSLLFTRSSSFIHFNAPHPSALQSVYSLLQLGDSSG